MKKLCHWLILKFKLVPPGYYKCNQNISSESKDVIIKTKLPEYPLIMTTQEASDLFDKIRKEGHAKISSRSL